MRFTAPTKEFKLALDRLSVIPGTLGTLPIIRVTVDSFEGMTITRVTPEASMTIMVTGIEVLADGEAELDHVTLSKLIGLAPGTHVEVMHEKGQEYVIRSNKSRYVIRALDPGSMPHPPSFEGKGVELQVPTIDFLKLLDTAATFASKNTTDPHMMGVCLRSNDDKSIQMIATDRTTLVSIASGLTPAKGSIDVLLPEESCRALYNAFRTEQPEHSTMEFFKNGFRFFNASGSLQTVVSEMNLPNIAPFDKVRDSDPTCWFACDRAELTKALKRASYASQGDRQAVHLDITTNGMTIKGDNNRDAAMDEEIDGKGSSALVQKISASRLIAVLDKCQEEEVQLRIHTQGIAALVIRGSDRFFFLGLMQ